METTAAAPEVPIGLMTCAVAPNVATIAGNLVLIGSAANLIVASAAADEEAKQAREHGDSRLTKTVFAAGRHAKFGVPLTLVTCVIGVIILVLELKWLNMDL